jgi:hypothetical protein
VIFLTIIYIYMLVITVAGKPSAAEDLLIPLTNLSEEHVDDAIRTERAGHGRANRRRWIESLVMIQSIYNIFIIICI